MATLEQIIGALSKADAAGEEQDAQKLAQAMREHPTFRQNAKEKLDNGTYKLSDDGYTELSKDEQRANMSKYTARSLGLRDSEVDVTQGMGTYGRFKLSFQPTEQDKVKHLEDTYGRENIRAVDIGGKMKLLYRDEEETGGQFRAVDEEGVSLADFFGDTAGTALPIAGAVGAAIATGGTSIPLMAGAAAAGGFAASAGQDVAVRAGSGEDIEFGEIAKRRGIEAAIGVPIDLATGGVGKFISKRIGKTATDAFADSLGKAETRLRKKGFDVERTTGMETSRGAAAEESVIAGKRPQSAISKKLEGIRDTLGDFQRAAQGGDTDTSLAFGKTLQRIQGEADDLVAEISAQDAKLGKTIQKSLQRRIDAMQVEQVGLDDLGGRVRGLFQSGRSVASKQNEANWANLESMAIDRGVSTTAKQMASSLDGALSKFKVKRNPEVSKVLKNLEDRGDEVIDFKTLRETIETIQDAVPTGGAVGGKTAQQVASASAEALRDLRDKVIKSGGSDFSKAYEDTTKYYLDNFLQFERGAVGRSLADKLGGDVLTNTQVAKSVIQDPQTVREALKAARMGGGAESASLVRELRKAYMGDIGLGRTGVDVTGGIRFNPEVIRELYGTGSDGVFRFSRGQRKVEALNQLNRSLKQSKVKRADITPENVDELLSSLTPAAQKEVIRSITRRATAQEAEDKALENVLWKKIAKGQWDVMDNELFADSALRASPKQVREIVKKMPEESREPFRQDFARNIFSKAQGGEQLNSRGASLWNPDKLDGILKRQKAQIKAAMGDDFYDDLLAANDFMRASESLTGQAADVALRASGGPQGFHFFLVGSVLNAFRDRFMGWAYGSGAMKPLIRLMNKNVSDEQFAKNFQRIMATMIGTRKGIQALAREAEGDPQFKEAAMQMIDGMQSQGAE